mmetsp:Transcript_162603/g.521285  ORF Transcript_162603/g.521285 Transcript_162603/m.521285 type:complete len:449 (+) Transcript_162603:176-1522(+)
MVNFLITEVDGQQAQQEEASDALPGLTITSPTNAVALEDASIFNGINGPAVSPASSVSTRVLAERAKNDASVALPMISIYRVEDAELPVEATGDTVFFAPAPLPEAIPMDKVMSNIVQNLDFKAWSGHARAMWFKDFKLPPSRAVMSDTFWFCICWYFKSGKHKDVEKRLFDRISANFVFLFEQIGPARKDLFFRFYADAAAQAVLYAMFLAYPKSRVNFTESFRRDLVIRISYWTTGICPEFVDTSHWKLNLGGGDVLQATTSPAWQRGAEGSVGAVPSAGGAGAVALACPSASQPMCPGQALSADSLAGRRASLAHRAPRPFQTLRYSPLVAHFLKTRKFSSVNFVRPLRMGLTSAEERSKLMDVKHAMLVERANMARKRCDQLNTEYTELCSEVKRQEWQRQAQAQAGKKRLEIRRKEVLRSDPHEYANYLVSLHLLQQGLGQSA